MLWAKVIRLSSIKMKRTCNRRVWSHRRKRGITDVLEFSTPQAGIVATVTVLELWDKPANFREKTLASYYLGIGAPVEAVLADNQEEAQ